MLLKLHLAEHEAHLLAADERAARRWADQAERKRVEHEEEKLAIAEAERERARERIQNELAQIESDNAITRERFPHFLVAFIYFFRLNQERAIEKERQQQHLDYLKESNQTQIATLTSMFCQKGPISL